MASLSFPSNPVNGELYPVNPPLGESQYQYDASANTWRLIGPASGAIAGTYGTPYQVPQITIDSSGRILVAQNIPIAATAGDLQVVTDNGNTTTNPINIQVTGASLGLLVVDSDALPNRVEIHPTYIAVRNGLIEVEEGGVPSISINPLGVPVITVRRGGYMTLGNGTSVYVETIRLNGQDGSAAFDGELIGNAVITNTSFEVDNGGPNPVARIADTGNFLPDLTIGNLTYTGTDNLPGYVLTTDGLGNISLQPPSAVSASTLQAVTDNGNTTTNDIELLAVGGFPTVILGAAGLISLPPQLPGEPGTYLDPSSLYFGNSTGSIFTTGLNPASLNFGGSLGVDLTTNGATTPVSLKPGGITVFSVTGTATTVSNTLVASGLSYPTSDGTTGQVLTTDGSGNLSWRSVVSTYGNLQEVTDQGATTTNTMLLNGTSNPDYPLIIISNASREAAEIRGRVSDGGSVLRFTSNDGLQTYGFLEGGATFLRLGAGAGTATVNITGTSSEITTPTTLSGGLFVSGNFSGNYQLQTAGDGGITVADASAVIRASIQGVTGNITTQGTLEASGLRYPATDGAPGQVMSTDGNGNLGWGSQSTGNLQQVTDNGSTTTNAITVGGITSTGPSNLQAPVNADSVQISTLATLDDLGFGFQDVSNTLAFNNNMVLCYTEDPVAGSGSRIIARGADLIIGTQGGPGPVHYYSELIRISQGSSTLQPNTSSVSLGYGDGTFKLTTTATGVDVAGSVVSQGLTSSGQANFQNDVVLSPFNTGTGTGQILLGTADQFRIYADTFGNSYFVNEAGNTTGNLTIGGNVVSFLGSDGTTVLASFDTAGSSSLYGGGSPMVSTTSTGANALGDFNISGALVASGLAYPTSDGQPNQFLTTDGNGILSWGAGSDLEGVTQAGNTTTFGINSYFLTIFNDLAVETANINPDGQLTCTEIIDNGNLSIGDFTYTRFFVDGSTGVVSIGTSDAGAGSSSTLDFYASGNLNPTASIAAATGNITTAGIVTSASLVAANLAYPTSDGTAGQVLTTNGAGILSWGTPGTPTLQQVTNTGSTTTNTITVGGLVASGLTYPNSDGSSGQFLRTNGAGTLSWATPATPTLQQVTNSGATTTGSITTGGLSTAGAVSAGTLVASGLNYPTSDGTANQVLKTNGSGTLGWQSVPVIVSAPASSSSPGSLGQIGFDTDYIYWHNGTQWVRAQGTTF